MLKDQFYVKRPGAPAQAKTSPCAAPLYAVELMVEMYAAPVRPIAMKTDAQKVDFHRNTDT
jgi:hypothetical protein